VAGTAVTPSPALLMRVLLAGMTLIGLQIGVWALIWPQGWFDEFPGFGRAWVAADGVYNEHLVRDVGAAYLALGALAAWSAVVLRRDVVVATAAAWVLFGLPHFAYHLTTVDLYGTGDAIANVASLGTAVVIPGLVAGLAMRLPRAVAPLENYER